MSEYLHTLNQLAFAYGSPVGTAQIKLEPADFQVDEELGFDPDGEGDHLFIKIRKTGMNTIDTTQVLARYLDVNAKEFGFSGLKDKQAVTTQWISCPWSHTRELPSFSIGESDEGAELEVLSVSRHAKKLRRGTHKSNHFRILLKNFEGDMDALEQRLVEISEQGVPNYFGLQRFGRNASNLDSAWRLLIERRLRTSRFKRGMYISAARSFLFNLVLSERVTQGNWLTGLGGDAFVLSGSRSFFVAESIDSEIQNRLLSGDISASGPLVGSSESPAIGVARELEKTVLDAYPEWNSGIAKVQKGHDRRPLRLVPGAWSHQCLDSKTALLSFTLPKGAFATSVLRELTAVG